MSKQIKLEKKKIIERIIDVFVGSLSILITVSIFSKFIFYANSGFEFTDEGYYVVMTAHPFMYPWTVSQFGFIYNPLYLLLDGDIAGMRQANIALTFALSIILVSVFLKKYVSAELPSSLGRYVAAAGLSCASLLLFSMYPPTPSYNSLSMQALLIVTIGLVLSEKTLGRNSVVGWFLIAIGGWLTFMAKPTTAIALIPIVMLYLLLAGKYRLQLALGCAAAALLALISSAFFIDGDPLAFYRRLKIAAELGSYLGGGYDLGQILRLDSANLDERFRGISILTCLLTIGIAVLLKSKNTILQVGGIAACAGLTVFVLATLFGYRTAAIASHVSQNFLLLSVTTAGILMGLFASNATIFTKVTIQRFAIVPFLLVLPHIYAFGTNDNYWHLGGYAGLFWLLSGIFSFALTVQGKNIAREVLGFALISQALVSMLLIPSFDTPYRQNQSLREQRESVTFGIPPTTLTLSATYAGYIKTAMEASHAAGFEPKTPVLDLTGQSPGLLYAIGATNLGQPWMIGGYPGSDKFVMESLKGSSCSELARAWLLVEESGPRSLSRSVPASFGAAIDEDYATVATWTTAPGSGGYSTPRTQQLLMPTRSLEASISNCNAARM